MPSAEYLLGVPHFIYVMSNLPVVIIQQRRGAQLIKGAVRIKPNPVHAGLQRLALNKHSDNKDSNEGEETGGDGAGQPVPSQATAVR